MANVRKEEKGLLPSQQGFAEISQWERELERAFGDFVARSLRPFGDEHRRTQFSFGVSAPAVDVYDEENEIVAKAELPGMEKDSIQVKIRNHQLTIKGEKKRQEKIAKGRYYLSERPYGSFARVLDLPANVQTDKARTTFKNGVLEIRVPKSERVEKKQIKIKVE